MAEVKSVVGDVCQRLDADFSENSSYLSSEARDLQAWSEIQQSLRAGRGSGELEDDNDRRRRNKLLKKCRQLCEALQVQWSSQTFFVAVRVALAA